MALEAYPDFIVNISGVTDGCDCEEGSQCTAQVWLALYRNEQIHGLVLSKISGHFAPADWMEVRTASSWSTYVDVSTIQVSGEHRMRTERGDHYFDNGNAKIGPEGMAPLIWISIKPGTVSAADEELVCGWNGK